MRMPRSSRSSLGSGFRSFQSITLTKWQLVGLETASGKQFGLILLQQRGHEGDMHVSAWRSTSLSRFLASI
ncbi:hypothetical protein LINPERHAP2_LOCUS9463 [Linum perenne]